MERAGLSHLRVLAVGGHGHVVRTLRTVLGVIGIRDLIIVEEPRRAVELLCSEHFDAVFFDDRVAAVDDLAFPLAARQTPGIINPLLPVFAVYGGVRRRQVEQVRDLGVTDLLTRPISARTVINKLRAALLTPRPFIAAPGFFGPDRRTHTREVEGQDRRTVSPKKVRVSTEAPG